jgi:hypothetical protein
MKKICIYFKAEVSEHLIDLGKYDGLCLKRRKDTHVQEARCLKGGKCKKWAETKPLPVPKKPRRQEELPF